MRVLPLLAMTFPLAMLMPLAAHAAWPEGTRQQYMSDCVAKTTQTVSKEKATAHCYYGAQVIDKKFSTAEIQQLMSKTPPPTVALRARLQQEVAVCKAKS